MHRDRWFGYFDSQLPAGVPRWVGRTMALGVAIMAGGAGLMAITALIAVVLALLL